MAERIDPIAAGISQKEPGDRISGNEAEIIQSAFAELYAAVLRYVRGAGEISHLADSIRTASAVLGKIEQCSQVQVDGHLRAAADWQWDERKSAINHEKRALDRMCSGALQIVASRLLGPRQGGAESKGEDQMIDGIERYLEVMNEKRS